MVGIYSRQNDIEQACKWLKITAEKSKQAGVNNWGYMNKAQEFENVRKAPCYKEIAK
jgi:hypothetical protein